MGPDGQGLVADAVALEDAAQVLERRIGTVIPGHRSGTWDAGVLAFLRYGARVLRDEAERDV